MTPPYFNKTAWIERLAAALEHVAAAARPSYYPPPTELGGYRSSDERQSALNRAYRDLAAWAKYDPTASIQFKESYLQVNADPVEAMAILREHPLIAPALVDSGREEAVGFRILGKTLRATLHGLVARLAKLSIKDGGKKAALCLHRYLTAGANGTVPAHEITVVHGLVVKTRFDLCAGAYLAPYGDARAEFGLLDEPETMSKTSYPDAAVFVRSLEYGPGVAPPNDDYGLPDVQISYRFPGEHRIDLERWFEDRLLVDLLSIATRFPLLSRTRYVRLPGWIEDINPNFAHGFQQSAGNVSDVWPAGHDLSTDDVASFLEMARGWRTYADRPDAMNLATRRLAGSFSRPGGRFGLEDRILDVAIALEVLYGGTTGNKLAQRAAALLGDGETAAEPQRTYDEAGSFYDVRNRIMHGKTSPPSRDVLDQESETGRNLACLTLATLLNRDAPVKWADVTRNLDSIKLRTAGHGTAGKPRS